MNLDEVLGAWRTQEQAPLYQVNHERLRQALRQDLAAMQRKLRFEGRVVYGMSALMSAGMGFLLLIMVYDDDPRTWWDFVIAILGAATFVLWAVHVYVSRTTLALRQRHLGASLRNEIARHLTLLDYQIGRTWRPGGILRTVLPLFFGFTALLLATWRVNNEPFDWGLQGLSILVFAFSLAVSAWSERRKAERETLPRRRRLEALLRELEGS